ncbi:hypothetical protein LINPERHAP1_LOCUS32187, partial [Linum perenne]
QKTNEPLNHQARYSYYIPIISTITCTISLQLVEIGKISTTQLFRVEPIHVVRNSKLPVNGRFLVRYQLWKRSRNCIRFASVEEHHDRDSWL